MARYALCNCNASVAKAVSCTVGVEVGVSVYGVVLDLYTVVWCVDQLVVVTEVTEVRVFVCVRKRVFNLVTIAACDEQYRHCSRSRYANIIFVVVVCVEKKWSEMAGLHFIYI